MGMTSDLNELSFENLVRFYSEELRMIEQGERATNVLTPRVRGRLRDVGILAYRNMEWLITEGAKKLLSML
jgi:hypothetical protein